MLCFNLESVGHLRQEVMEELPRLRLDRYLIAHTGVEGGA